jgi:hypothetical protein
VSSIGQTVAVVEVGFTGPTYRIEFITVLTLCGERKFNEKCKESANPANI